MNQREAVFEATKAVLAEAGVHFETGMNVSDVMTKELRQTIHGIVQSGFKTGRITLDDTTANNEKRSNDAKLSAYVSGLISNWFRKDRRLNGDVAFCAKNPGSRAGSSDPEIKALRILAKNYDEGSNEFKTIQSAIAEKLAAFQAQKAKVSVDMSVISPELCEKLGLN